MFENQVVIPIANKLVQYSPKLRGTFVDVTGFNPPPFVPPSTVVPDTTQHVDLFAAVVDLSATVVG